MRSEERSRLVVCVGGGSIGSEVAGQAAANGASVLVIDRDPGCQASLLAASKGSGWAIPPSGEIRLAVGEVIEVLVDLLSSVIPDELVPAVPGHLLGRLAVAMLRERGVEPSSCPGPMDDLLSLLGPGMVQLVDRDQSVVVVSHMPPGGLCQPECGQPETCPVTMRSRAPMNLLVTMALQKSVDHALVARAAKVGGYGGVTRDDLERLRDMVEEAPSGTIGVATCCRCHGIINLLREGKA